MCKLFEDDIIVGVCIGVVGHKSVAAKVRDRHHHLLKCQFTTDFAVMLDRVW